MKKKYKISKSSQVQVQYMEEQRLPKTCFKSFILGKNLPSIYPSANFNLGPQLMLDIVLLLRLI